MTTDEHTYLQAKRGALSREMRILRGNGWHENELSSLRREYDRINRELRFYDDWKEAERLNNLTPDERIRQKAQDDVNDMIRVIVVDQKGASK